jgi:putative hemolysin
MGNIWIPLSLQLIFILINALFSCAEIAIITINDKKLTKLADGGDRRALRLVRLTGQPAKFFSVTQVVMTLAGFIASAFAADSFAGGFTDSLVNLGIPLPEPTLRVICVVLITLILSYFMLVLGELVPKRIAMRHAERVGLAMSGFVCAVAVVLTPVVWFLTVSTNIILRLIRIDPNAVPEDVTEEEIKMMVEAGAEKGTIDEDEKEFIHNLFNFDDITAKEVMTHRTDVVFLWSGDSAEDWGRTIHENFHNVYPVCGEDVDDVTGILIAKDYFLLKDKNEESVKACVRPAYIVPETIRTDVLFANMKKERSHFALVYDEYGGMSGIVTIMDLLEELVGDLDNDTPEEEPPDVEDIDGRSWRILGGATLETVSEHLGVSLPDDGYDTFGGLVFDLLGAIPENDETPEIEGYGLSIKVTEVKNHRIIATIVSVMRTGDE